MSLVVARTTWRLAARRRRLFAWNLLVPILLLAPVVASEAAPVHRALVVVAFVVFFGTYGSCIPLIRDGMSGWAEKVLLAGYGGRRWVVERIGASAVLDWLQLLPANLLLAWLARTSAPTFAAILGATLVALLAANVLGALVAAAVRALGEAALGCAVLALFTLHAAGVFRTPRPGTPGAIAETWSPVRPLHHAWLDALGAGSSPASVGPPLFTLLLLVVVVAAAGNTVAHRVASARG